MVKKQITKLLQEAQALHKKGKLAAAGRIYERIIEIDEAHEQALIFLALIKQAEHNQESALNYAERAYNASRTNPLILVNYGVILKNCKKYELAAQVYNEALRIEPSMLAARANLATVYMLQGQLGLAEVEFKRIVQKTEDVAPLLNLSRIEIAKNNYRQASKYLDQARARDPGHRDMLAVSALLASKDNDDELAFEQSIQALKSNPISYELWQALRKIDADSLRMDDVELAFSNLLRTNSTDVGVFSAAVDIARKNTLWTHLPELEDRLNRGLESRDSIRGSATDCFTLLGANISQHAHRKLSEYVWKRMHTGVAQGKVKKLRNRIGNKLRVGFLSYDFRNHAIGHLIVGLIELLPQNNVFYVAYSNSDDDASDTRNRIVSSISKFTNISKLSDNELIDVIQQDEIDVLIDLSQWTSGSRVSIFQHRPAEIQIQWLGMPGTLGATDCCDYIIADRWVIDEENVNGFAENVLLLNRSYQPNDHIKPDLSLGGTKCENNLPTDSFVFCSFNQHYKFSPDTINAWIEILKSVSHSVLWLLDTKSEKQKANLISYFTQAGVSAERIIFAEHKPHKEHIARLRHADLVLDTWPYNAHTTCSDALRAGVPVVTLPGKVFASRVAAGILKTSGLDEWIANDVNNYIDKAIQFSLKDRSDVNDKKRSVYETYWSSKMVDNLHFGSLFENMVKNISMHHQKLIESSIIPVDGEGNIDFTSLGVSNNQNKTIISSSVATCVNNDADEPFVPGRDKISNLRFLYKNVIDLPETPLLVDVGAAIFDWDPSKTEYLINANLLKVLGFEPDMRSFQKLKENRSVNKMYLNKAVGDGNVVYLNLLEGSHMSSVLLPNAPILKDLMGYKNTSIVDKIQLETVRLDDVLEAEKASMLKIDTQGTELLILKNASSLLESLVIIQIEAAFLQMYVHQPSFFKIGSWLEDRGFIMLQFEKFNYQEYKTPDIKSSMGCSQLLEVDPVFIPNPLLWDKMSCERLKSLAFLLHSVYGAHDVAIRVLWTLDKFNEGSICQKYIQYLEQAGLYA